MPNYAMPEGFDQNKIPGSRVRLTSPATNMSGRNYLVTLLKGDSGAGWIRIASPRTCKHGTTICASPEKLQGGYTCAESWQIDYSLLWHRTAGGREMLHKLGLMADKHHNPEHPARIEEARVARATARLEQIAARSS